MSRIAQEKANNDDKIMTFRVGNDDVKLSTNIVKRYLSGDNKNVTESEIMYFMKLCKARNLNPFIRDVYLIKYGTLPAAVVVAKDAIEKRAIKHEKYNGKEVGIYVLDKTTGELTRRNGSIYIKNKEDLVGAWCTVYRKDWEHPITKEVNFDEYIQRKSDGSPNTNWANRPVTMLTKVASTQALREAFIEELSGMYEAEEMGIDGKELDETPIEQPKDSEIQEAEIVTEDDNLENELFGDTAKNPFEE